MPITILNDDLVEEAESFYLSLESLSPVMRVARNSANFVIEDDDCKWVQLSASFFTSLKSCHCSHHTIHRDAKLHIQRGLSQC